MKRLKEMKEWLHAKRIAVRSMDRNKKIKIGCCCLMLIAVIGMTIHSHVINSRQHYLGDYSEYYNGVCGDNVTYHYDERTHALTIEGNGIMYDYPDKYTTPWYKFGSSIYTIVIREGVRSVGAYNFAGLCNIMTVTIPATVTEIGDYAFYDCSDLNKVRFPSLLRSIGKRAFQSCSSLKSVTLPDNGLSVGEEAFENINVTRNNMEDFVDDLQEHVQDEEFHPSYSDNEDSSETEQEEFVWTPDMSVEQYYQGRPTNLEQTGFYNSQTGQVQQNPVQNQTINPELDQNGISVVTGGSRGNSGYLIDQTSIGGKGADLIGTGSSGSSSSRRKSPSRKYSTSEINRQADRTARAYQNYKNNPTIDGANYYHMQEKTLKRMQENK